MTPTDRQRLAAILGMLGSNHAGERAAAGLQAEAFRNKHGLTWDQLVSGKTVDVDREVAVETAVFIDRPMPLVASFVAAVGSPFPAFFLILITFTAVFDVITRLLNTPWPH
jgi:hypothetical protein